MINNTSNIENGAFDKTFQTFPKQQPQKPLQRNLRVKAMISMDLKGFGLCPLV
jgi:hypothetical protein